MPECKQCEGAGTVISMPNGLLVPFYKAPVTHNGYKIRCEKCDGWGRVIEEEQRAELLPVPKARKKKTAKRKKSRNR